MSEIWNQKLEDIFLRIPLLANCRAEEFQITPLPGHTNRNIQIRNNSDDWVLRIPRDDTDRYIDRQAEAVNAAVAHSLGLAPECLWRDDSGLSLSVTLRHTRTLTRDDLQQEPMRRRLANLLKKLHRSNCTFQGGIDLDVLLTRYYRLMPAGGRTQLQAAYHNAKGKIKTLAQCDDMPVPSHKDLVLENLLLDDSGRIWIIDWEYASMASPYWDLATLCNAADLDYEQSLNLLLAYQGDTAKIGMDLLKDYRTVLQVLSDCWMTAFTEPKRHAEMEGTPC